MFLYDESFTTTSDLCVTKRDGHTVVPFNRTKITNAIKKAFISSGEGTGDLDELSDSISEIVLNDILRQRKLHNKQGPISIEDIQNHVEIGLMLKNYYQTAKKFIIYRQKRTDARELTIEKFISLIDEYLTNDYKENSNMDFSLQGLNNFVTTKVMNTYWLNKVLSPDMKNAHLTGDLHIHDLNLLSSYCSGWDLRDLLLRGFGGVAGTNSSGPAKHFETALGQVWNFLYSMQGEAAGAQALSNFDTFLAPFIRHDKLDYKEIKQNFQKFFHNMTTKTRVGFQCVPDTYQCMTPEGWKYYHELRVGDPIYVVDSQTKELKLDILQNVNIYDYDGEMIRFSGRKIDFLTTPNHRTIRRKFNSDEWVIETSGDIYSKYKTPIDIPLAAEINRPGVDMSDDEIRLLGWALTDCHMDSHGSRLRIYQSPKKHAHSIAQLLIRLDADWYANETGGGGYGDEVYRFDVKGRLAKSILEYTNGYREAIPLDFLNNASVKQIQILLDTIIQADGTIEVGGRIRIAKKNDYMAECLQSLLLMIGYGSKRNRRLSYTDTVTVYKKNIATTVTSKVLYQGTVWCPTTSTGTFVCRTDDGVPFLTGNSPFTNVSMDLTVPVHMANDAVIIGGKLTESTYGEYQHEMDLFNRAFCEVMLEGDYEGRQFPFPIPNYNITADFDWDNPVLDTLWKLTGKYGSPYFTNFVNSDMKPEDVRSMCPLHPDEKLHIRMNGHYVIMRIEDIYKNLSHRTFSSVFVRCRGEEIEVDQVVRNNPKGFIKIRTSLDPDGITMDYTHQQPIRNKIDDIEYMVVSAKSLKNIKNFYVPYSVTGYENDIPEGTFVSNGFLWVPVIEVEDMGLMCNHSYCISVKSEEALFEMGPGKLVTHNCRLKLDNRVLRKRGGGLFGANPLTGSIGVVTINLPKLGYKFKGNKEAFYTELSRLMDMSAQMLYDKRLFIEAMMKKGLYPFMRTYMQQIYDRFEQYFFNHFSTIGVIGGNECALNFMGKNIVDSEGKEFVKEILNFARDRMLEYQDKYGCPFNLEATPKSVGRFIVI